MKRFLSILLVAFVATIVMQAQDNTNYLAKAFELLLEGNIESAEKHYIVHKKLTGQTDNDFEALLQEKKEKGTQHIWEEYCFMISSSDSILAVQKVSISNQTFSWSEANRIATSSRLGEYSDWRLPTEEELSIILCNLSLVDFCPNKSNPIADENWYWTTTKRDAGIVVLRHPSILSIAEVNHSCNFLIIRKYENPNRPRIVWFQYCGY